MGVPAFRAFWVLLALLAYAPAATTAIPATATTPAAKPQAALPPVKATKDSASAAKASKSHAAAAKPATKAKPATTSAPAKPAPATPVKPSSVATPVKPATGTTLAKDTLVPPIDTLAKPLRDLGQKALKVPEKLLFDVVWGGWGFRWVTAGQATLELLPTERADAWKIQSLAWCNSFFQSIYPVRDTVFSIIDSRGIYPIRFEKRLHEGKYHADISATYDQGVHTLKTQDTALSIEPFTHDVLSAFYFIRTQTLKVGDTLDLAAVSGKKKYQLKVLCHARETITVPAGEFRTLVVEPVLKEDGLFKAKGKLTIWVTDDLAHTPVKMESKIPVGSIKAELVRKTVSD